MSFSYSFRKQDFPFETWREQVEQLVVAADPGQARVGTWREMLLSSVLRNNDEDDAGGFYAHFLVEGSIRGVVVGEEDDTIIIMIRSFASRTDQYLAARLAWEALQLGAQVEKEGDGIIGADDLQAEAVEAAHREWFALSKAALNGVDEAQLPIYDFLSLVTGPSDGHLEDIDLERKLVQTLARFGDAYPSTRVVAELSGIGEQTLGILQHGMSTLMTKDIQGVLLDEKFLPLEPLVAALGQEVHDGQGCWVLPPVENLNPMAVQMATVLGDIVTNQTPAAAPAAATGPTDEEWDLISCGPVIAFIAVAGADGKIDKKEIEQFSRALEGLASQQEHPEVASMMGLARGNLEDILPRIMNNEVGPIQLMQEFTRLVDLRFAPPQAKNLKYAIYAVAHTVAESSGGFLGLGPKISKKEEQTLGAIASLLGLV